MTSSEVSFLFLDDPGIAALNGKYLFKPSPTDVIAFPQDFSGNRANPHRLNLGDVAISVERARSQAREYSKTFYDELTLLMVHGILHLISYDDTNPRARREMRRMERKILKRLVKI